MTIFSMINLSCFATGILLLFPLFRKTWLDLPLEIKFQKKKNDSRVKLEY